MAQTVVKLLRREDGPSRLTLMCFAKRVVARRANFQVRISGLTRPRRRRT
jgi:hypothetical protein